tara:strand:+ start:2804 stop:3379 length:576 start_codon:yes stop_codon:yes gene_type:complete
MFICKKKYFLIIENIKDIDLKSIKIFEKFIIIYRNQSKLINIEKLSIFRNQCKAKRIDFYVANDFKLMSILKADGLYISAYNTDLRMCRYKYSKYKIIGSAHNYKELKIKDIQGCSSIIYSRLFETKYKNKPGFLGLIRFNLLSRLRKEILTPLGGININNLNKMNIVNSTSLALMSEVKKKPAKIFSRLF